MSRSLIISLMLYPKLRREIVETWGFVYGEPLAKQFAEEVDGTMVAIGNCLHEFERAAAKPDAKMLIQGKALSLELRELAKRHTGPHPSTYQLADWLDQFCTTDRDLHSQN